MGERSFGFDSLKYMNCDMEEKGIDASGQPAAVSERFRLLQIDVEEEEPETSENPSQSFVIHNIVWRRTHLLAVIICII